MCVNVCLRRRCAPVFIAACFLWIEATPLSDRGCPQPQRFAEATLSERSNFQQLVYRRIPELSY
jgi:hypothetical protein